MDNMLRFDVKRQSSRNLLRGRSNQNLYATGIHALISANNGSNEPGKCLVKNCSMPIGYDRNFFAEFELFCLKVGLGENMYPFPLNENS